MNLKNLVPWKHDKGHMMPSRKGVERAHALRADLNQAFEDFRRDFRVPAPFETLFGGRSSFSRGGLPRVDARESDKEVDVEAELPGMDEKDIDVSVAEGTLVIRGEKKAGREEKDRGYIRRERSFGRIERVVPLPEGLDLEHAKAVFKKGVLTVAIPRTRESQASVKHIDVRGG